MDDLGFSLLVLNIPKIDLLELDASMLPGIDVTLRPMDQSEARYGEPATILALITLGQLALPPLLLWLSRKRIKFTVKVDETITNSETKRIVTIDAIGSGPPDAETIQTLTRLPHLDQKALSEAVDSLTRS